MSPTFQAPTSKSSECISPEKHLPSSITTAAPPGPTRRQSYRVPPPAAIHSGRYLHYLKGAGLPMLEEYDSTTGYPTGIPKKVALKPLSLPTRDMLRSTTEMGMVHATSIPGEQSAAPIPLATEYEEHLGRCAGGAEELVPSRMPARICIVEPLPCRPPTSMGLNFSNERARRDSVLSSDGSGNKMRAPRSHRDQHYVLEDRLGPLIEEKKARKWMGIARRWGRWLKGFGTHRGKKLQKHLE